MATVTRIKLTPKDHDREMNPDLFELSTGEEGYKYELIDGRVYVSPVPDMPTDSLEVWLFEKLYDYRMSHPEVIGYLSRKTRIFIPTRKKATRPEPDIGAYSVNPRTLPKLRRHWQYLSPFLVAEVVSKENADKDYVRNVELYAEVPTIMEYWVLDGVEDPDRPSLRVYRRRGKGWQKPIDVPFGGTYQTPRVLPGFTLVVDPDR
jgi:Uma2 family endonuclease